MAVKFRILDTNWVDQTQTVVTPSSENTNFPASNIQNEIRGKIWRTTGYYVIDATNNKIDFKESGGGGELTATLTPGSYSKTGLETEIKTQMEVAGAEIYTVSRSAATGKWTITTGGAFLSLLWSSGTNTAASVGPDIGFAVSDDTGATTYTGSTIAIHTEENVVFDVLTTEAVDSVALVFDARLGSGLTSSAVVSVQANATDSWAAPAVDQVITLDTNFDWATHFFSTDQSYRYWRVKIVDPANPNLYVGLSKVLLSNATELTQTPEIGWKINTDDQTKITKTAYGHEYKDVYPLRRSMDFSYKVMTYADLETLTNIYNTVGTSQPIAISLDGDEDLFDKERFFMYCRFERGLSAKHVVTTFFDLGLQLVEVI